MIVYGCSVTVDAVYRARALPGLQRVAAPEDRVLAHAAVGPLARTYNLVLDEAAQLDDLEAVVLVHQDAELATPDAPARIRAALADPAVGLVGPVGARGVDSPAWWDGDVVASSVTYAYGELGGGAIAAPALHPAGRATAHPHGPVDVLYGVVLVLAPWVVRTLRFDEGLGQRYGYDYDLCRQVRAAGGEVRCVELPVIHHHALHLLSDPAAWAVAHRRAVTKWREEPEEGWRARARAMEADAGSAQLVNASRVYELEAVAHQHAAQREAITGSAAWRSTRPLRELRARRG